MRHYLINSLGEFFMYWQTGLYMTHYLISFPNKKVRPVMFLSTMVITRTQSQKSKRKISNAWPPFSGLVHMAGGLPHGGLITTKKNTLTGG